MANCNIYNKTVSSDVLIFQMLQIIIIDIFNGIFIIDSLYTILIDKVTFLIAVWSFKLNSSD